MAGDEITGRLRLRTVVPAFAACCLSLTLVLGWVLASWGQEPAPSVVYNYSVKQFPTRTGDSTDVEFYLSLSYDNLVFVQAASGYKAEIRFNLFVMQDDDVQFEQSWRQQAEVADYYQTRDDSTYIYFNGHVILAPGKYRVVTEAIDINIGHSSFRNHPLVVENQSKKQVVLGDILNVAADVESINLPRSVLRIVPHNVNRGDFYLLCEARVPRELDDLVYEAVWFENQREVRRDSLEYVGQENLLRLFRRYTIEEVPTGHFEVDFQIKGEGLKESSRKIELQIIKLTGQMQEASLDDAIEQLKYIGQGVAYDSLRRAETLEAKQYWFDRYWRDNYPSQDSLRNPIKEEYYRRVLYANRMFGNGLDGWRSDRGHTHIVYGPPDEIRNSVDNRMRRYQIWQYNEIRRQFVFYDEYGTGDFRLVRQY